MFDLMNMLTSPAFNEVQPTTIDIDENQNKNLTDTETGTPTPSGNLLKETQEPIANHRKNSDTNIFSKNNVHNKMRPTKANKSSKLPQHNKYNTELQKFQTSYSE